VAHHPRTGPVRADCRQTEGAGDGYSVFVRFAAALLGGGATVFGVVPAVAPGAFARLFGIAAGSEPSVATAIRSVGVRDVVTGVGLLNAATSNDERALRQWLMTRVACDAGDGVAVALAIAAGERNPRFLALGGLAIAAAAFGALLVKQSK